MNIFGDTTQSRGPLEPLAEDLWSLTFFGHIIAIFPLSRNPRIALQCAHETRPFIPRQCYYGDFQHLGIIAHPPFRRNAGDSGHRQNPSRARLLWLHVRVGFGVPGCVIKTKNRPLAHWDGRSYRMLSRAHAVSHVRLVGYGRQHDWNHAWLVCDYPSISTWPEIPRRGYPVAVFMTLAANV